VRVITPKAGSNELSWMDEANKVKRDEDEKMSDYDESLKFEWCGEDTFVVIIGDMLDGARCNPYGWIVTRLNPEEEFYNEDVIMGAFGQKPMSHVTSVFLYSIN